MILEFKHVRVDCPPLADCGVEGVSFALSAGELVLVRVAHGQRRTAIPDLAQGLLAPAEGQVCIAGEDWQSLDPGRAAAQRGRIGRVFDHGGWLSNLDVDENVTLAQRFHTSRPAAEIQAEAQALAAQLGMTALPAVRPPAVSRLDLIRSQWVRALLGRPLLVVLDHAADELDAEYWDPLLAQVAAARAAGSGILWLTSDHAQWQEPRLNATLKFVLKHGKMQSA